MTAGIFFDLGGTLFSYRNVPRTTLPLLLEAVDRFGVEVDVAEVKAAYTRAQQEVTHDYASRSYYLHRDFFLATFTRFAELIGASHDEAIQDWYREAHRSAIVDCLALKDDCLDTLTHLRETGLYLSVVSNIDDDMLNPLIERSGLARWFDHWTSSEAARSCKPDRRFFEYALSLSGLDPAEVLFVGDSPEHDILGASQVGMRTALIVDGGMEPPLQTGRATAAPDHVIRNLAELRALLSG